MSQKNGAIIHVERGFRIAEVLDGQSEHAMRFVGYRVIGPGAEAARVFATEHEARLELSELLLRHAQPARDGEPS